MIASGFLAQERGCKNLIPPKVCTYIDILGVSQRGLETSFLFREVGKEGGRGTKAGYLRLAQGTGMVVRQNMQILVPPGSKGEREKVRVY